MTRPHNSALPTLDPSHAPPLNVIEGYWTPASSTWNYMHINLHTQETASSYKNIAHPTPYIIRQTNHGAQFSIKVETETHVRRIQLLCEP